MAAVQTAYSETIRPAVAGQKATMRPATIESRTCEPVGGMDFGAAVAQGSVSDKGGKVPASTAVTIGIVCRDRSAVGTNENGYAQGDEMAVMNKGDIWVVASVAVAPGDPVYVVPTTGVFAKTNAGSAIQIPNAKWNSTAGIGALAIVELR